ncbi:MAG: SET domain-containing protein [Hyphomonadaceae bacterium]
MPSKYEPGDYKLRVGRSSAGLGLFAEEDIPKGKCVIEYWGRELAPREDETINSKYLFAVSEKKTIDGADRRNTARYINHSCRPNCEPVIAKGRVWIFSRRAIKAGEELSYDYGKEYFNEYLKDCRCEKCREAKARAAA